MTTKLQTLPLGRRLVVAALYMQSSYPKHVAIGRTRSMWNYIFVAHGDDIKTSPKMDFYKLNSAAITKIFNELALYKYRGTLSGSDEERYVLLKGIANAQSDTATLLEFASKDYRIGPHIKIQTLDRGHALKLITTDLSIPLSATTKYFGDLPEQLTSDDIKIGNSVLLFPEGAKASNKKILTDLVKAVFKDLSVKGLGKLFNSPIRFVKMTGSTVGFYDITSKDIKVAYNASKNERAEFTLVHEYGHKYMYEFIPQRQAEIKAKFSELMKSGITHKDEKKDNILDEFVKHVKRGDIFTSSKPKFSQYEWTVIQATKDKMILRAFIPGQSLPAGSIEGSPLAFMQSHWSCKNPEAAKVMNYKATLKHEIEETSEWFPTAYSQKNHVEWFAELFAFYLRGALKAEPAQFMKSLIK